MSALRIGLLGAGAHAAQNHGPSWRDFVARNPGVVELVGVCDLDERRATEYAHGPHRERRHQGSGGRVPVVIEKPPGVGVEGAQRLLGVARQTGTKQWSPSIAVLRHL
jgi:predicted dehydrogenase